MYSSLFLEIKGTGYLLFKWNLFNKVITHKLVRSLGNKMIF